MRIIHLTVALALGAVPLSAAHARNDDPDEMVCKKQKRSDSRSLRKTCLTRLQWDRMSEEHNRAWTEMRDRPMIEIRN